MNDDDRLLALALGTFHAVTITLLLVVIGYLTTDLGHTLASFDTIIGLGVFAALWATSVYCTHRGLREAGLATGQPAPADTVLGKGLTWGAWNGMLFFWTLLDVGFLVLLYRAVADEGFNYVFAVFIFAIAAFAVGSILAAGIGGAVGILLAAIDFQLLRAARTLVAVNDSRP